MRTGRPKTYTITLDVKQRAQLETDARSCSLSHALVRRAKIVLLAADGLSNAAIAEKLDVSNPTITYWCRRFREQGLQGLYDPPSGGRARTYSDEAVARLMQQALDNRPADATHWSVRSYARETWLPKSTVHRYFALFGIQPHRTRLFKLTNDPLLCREGA